MHRSLGDNLHIARNMKGDKNAKKQLFAKNTRTSHGIFNDSDYDASEFDGSRQA